MTKEEFKKLFKIFAQRKSNQINNIASIFCNLCFDKRKADCIVHRYDSGIFLVIVEFCCRECASNFLAIWTKSEDKFILFPFKGESGIATINTPETVKFYLDQAFKSKSFNAFSAALAMYRVALDSILLEQGFTGRMLGNKLNTLKKAIKDNSAPKWAMELNTEFLEVIKELGNYTLHPGADVSKYKIYDEGLLVNVESVFKSLLFQIYEISNIKSNQLNELKNALNLVKS